MTQAEWLYAATRGIERQIDDLLRGRKPRHMAVEKQATEGWWWNINGACGEQVVAKWLGVSWDGAFGNFRAADVGGIVEVRTTTRHDYPLALHPSDPDDAPFILVTGLGPRWRIQGFLRGSKGKRPEWYHDRPPPAGVPTGRPAFWVPQVELQKDDADFDRLKDYVLARMRAMGTP